MPTIQRTVAIAAGATNENIIAGSQYEFARRRCVISVGMNGSAAGLVGQINSGGDVVAEQFPLSALNRIPVIPDDIAFQDVMEPGDRLSIPVQNPTGGALSVLVLVQIQDI